MTEPNPRDAVAARRDQIAAEPRPRTQHLIAEKNTGGQATDLYRLYRPEWQIAYVAADELSVDTLLRQVREVFERRWAGRVCQDDVRYDVIDADGVSPRAMILLRLPTVKGEFKFAFLAHRHAREQGWADFQVVARNSQADHELRMYGVKRLPT